MLQAVVGLAATAVMSLGGFTADHPTTEHTTLAADEMGAVAITQGNPSEDYFNIDYHNGSWYLIPVGDSPHSYEFDVPSEDSHDVRYEDHGEAGQWLIIPMDD